MKVISLLNIKGGVAKTVSTVNIATIAANHGYKVLVIDLDPQSNATKYLDMYSPEEPSIYELLKGEDHQFIKETQFNGVSIIPSNIKLIMSEAEILADTKRSREERLKKYLNKVNGMFDYVFIDCPPSLGVLTTNALVASNNVLVPIKIDRFAIDGFEYLLSFIEEVHDEFNSGLELLGAFITMDKATKINKEIKAGLSEVLGDKFFNKTIRENVEVVKSTFNSKPLIYFNKNAAATKDYMALVEDIICLI